MTMFLSLLLSLAGFATLACSMAKHHRDLFGAPPGKWLALSLRCAGWALLAASSVAAIAVSGPSIGIVLWFGIAAVAAAAVTMGLAGRPRGRRFPRKMACTGRLAIVPNQAEGLDP